MATTLQASRVVRCGLCGEVYAGVLGDCPVCNEPHCAGNLREARGICDGYALLALIEGDDERVAREVTMTAAAVPWLRR